MKQNWLLSPDRQLTEDERTLIWKKPASHVESAAERRICRAVKRNWNRGEMKISTILLEGDAGSGKTQLAKALSADFGLPYTKVTCFADMDKSDVLGAILPVLPEKSRQGSNVEYQYYPSEIVRAYENGAAICHELSKDEKTCLEEQKQSLRKRLNQEAREAVKGSLHEKVGMIVHRPESTPDQRREYQKIAAALMPVIQELTRKTEPLLEHEYSQESSKNRVYGSGFHAEKVAYPDFRCFSKKRPPDENPSLAVALRVDQSASMESFGRLEAAKEAAVAVCEFCEACGIPVLIYGDTADRSSREKMSMYAYLDWEEPALNDKYAIMSMQGISNNRDGMALRVLAEKLAKSQQATKLLISLSDGQPKAKPDYTGKTAAEDLKQTIKEYGRKGVIFLAAAIGQDKDAICGIYGQERFIDISDLKQLPVRLVQIIARYI